MKSMLRQFVRLSAGVALLGVVLAADKPSAGFVDFGTFTRDSANAEFVEVSIGSNLLSMAARLAGAKEPEAAEVLRGLQTVRVNVIGLGDNNRAEVVDRIEKIRGELVAKGWERIVTAQKKGEDVGVYVKTRGEEAVEGVVVTVLDSRKEAVLINIVGDIKPEKLSVLGERLDIEPLKKAGQALKKS
jgi:hypothetical protein